MNKKIEKAKRNLINSLLLYVPAGSLEDSLGNSVEDDFTELVDEFIDFIQLVDHNNNKHEQNTTTNSRCY